MRRLLVGAVATTALVLGTALPAWAIVSKSGTKYCPAYATARAEYYGSLSLLGPGDSAYQSFYSNGVWRVASNQGNPDGYWRAFVSGQSGLSDAGTYAYCHSGN